MTRYTCPHCRPVTARPRTGPAPHCTACNDIITQVCPACTCPACTDPAVRQAMAGLDVADVVAQAVARMSDSV